MLLDIPDGYLGPVNPTPGDAGEIGVSLFRTFMSVARAKQLMNPR